MLPQSVNEEDIKLFRPRKWFNGALSLLAYSVWGNLRHQIRITDPLHGIRGLSYKFISELKFNDFGVDADLAMVRHAYKENFTTLEVPVVETQREYGKTHFPAFRTGKSLILYIFRNFI